MDFWVETDATLQGRGARFEKKKLKEVDGHMKKEFYIVHVIY